MVIIKPLSKPGSSSVPEKRQQHRVANGLPTTTVHQARLAMFAPTRRPKTADKRITETAWGKNIVKGRLGQAHADFLELICKYNLDIKVDGSGDNQRLILLCDPYIIRKKLTNKRNQYSKSGVLSLIEDLKNARMTMYIKSADITHKGGFIDNVTDSEGDFNNPAKVLKNQKETRKLWRITLNPKFSEILVTDLALYYDPTKIIALRFGINQAIARLILTHRDQPNGGWKLDELIKTVSSAEVELIPEEKQKEEKRKASRKTDENFELRNRRRMVRADIEGFAALGIEVKGNRVFRPELVQRDWNSNTSPKRVVGARRRVNDARTV